MTAIMGATVSMRSIMIMMITGMVIITTTIIVIRLRKSRRNRREWRRWSAWARRRAERRGWVGGEASFPRERC